MHIPRWVGSTKWRRACVLFIVGAVPLAISVFLARGSLSEYLDHFRAVKITMYTASPGGEFARVGEALKDPLYNDDIYYLPVNTQGTHDALDKLTQQSDNHDDSSLGIAMVEMNSNEEWNHKSAIAMLYTEAVYVFCRDSRCKSPKDWIDLKNAYLEGKAYIGAEKSRTREIIKDILDKTDLLGKASSDVEPCKDVKETQPKPRPSSTISKSDLTISINKSQQSPNDNTSQRSFREALEGLCDGNLEVAAFLIRKGRPFSPSALDNPDAWWPRGCPINKFWVMSIGGDQANSVAPQNSKYTLANLPIMWPCDIDYPQLPFNEVASPRPSKFGSICSDAFLVVDQNASTSAVQRFLRAFFSPEFRSNNQFNLYPRHLAINTNINDINGSPSRDANPRRLPNWIPIHPGAEQFFDNSNESHVFVLHVLLFTLWLGLVTLGAMFLIMGIYEAKRSPRVFVTASGMDRRWLLRIRRQLSILGGSWLDVRDETVFPDDHGGKSSDLETIIYPYIDDADMYFFVLTQNSDNSSWCQAEYARARKIQQQTGLHVFIVYCESVGADRLARYNSALLHPDSRNPIAAYEDENEAWYELANQVRACLARLQGRSWRVKRIPGAYALPTHNGAQP